MRTELHLKDTKKAGELPIRCTVLGQNISPAVSWQGVTGLARSLAIICENFDSEPCGFTHWLVYNIPPTERELCENLGDNETLENGTRQGINDEGAIGYSGPKEKGGRYRFRLLALSHTLNNACIMDKEEFFNAVKGYVIDEAEVTVSFDAQD